MNHGSYENQREHIEAALRLDHTFHSGTNIDDGLQVKLLRRGSPTFSRGTAGFRGVSRHGASFEARINLIPEGKPQVRRWLALVWRWPILLYRYFDAIECLLGVLCSATPNGVFAPL
jgi:hypothetical protein